MAALTKSALSDTPWLCTIQYDISRKAPASFVGFFIKHSKKSHRRTKGQADLEASDPGFPD